MKSYEAGADWIFFPELSLSGYEPEMAKELALEANDPLFSIFQDLSDQGNIGIGLGFPLKANEGIKISMKFFRPNKEALLYSKQLLHEDEEAYFIAGHSHLVVESNGLKFAPSICYESMQEQHLQEVSSMGIDLYIASVAKDRSSLDRTYHYYPKVASKYKLPILMVNSIGPCDNLVAAGGSGAWNSKGDLMVSLNEEEHGVLLIDTHHL